MARPRKKFTENEKSLIVALYGEGKTDVEIAKLLNIPRKTFSDRVEYNGLTALMKKAKLPATKKVIEALYKRALGYEIEVKKIKTKTVKLMANDPRRALGAEEVVETTREVTTKHIPGDVNAEQFIVCNKDKDNWKNPFKIELSGDEGKPIPINLKIVRAERIKLEEEED